MVSRRNFVAITIIMAIVLFLFQGLNVAREKLNYYDTNAYAKDKETLADGSGAFGAVDASDQINIEGSRGTIVYIGAEKERLYRYRCSGMVPVYENMSQQSIHR